MYPGYIHSQPGPSETSFSSEFQGIEAMLNNSDPVDWVSLSTIQCLRHFRY